jgi:hypothetical protein
MTFKAIFTAAAACALMAGAAHSQSTAGSTPSPTWDVGAPATAPDGAPTTAVNPMSQPSTVTTTTMTVWPDTSAAAATSYGRAASVTTELITNGPVPDTAENRAKYGQPLSNAGKRTAAAGN